MSNVVKANFNSHVFYNVAKYSIKVLLYNIQMLVLKILNFMLLIRINVY